MSKINWELPADVAYSRPEARTKIGKNVSSETLIEWLEVETTFGKPKG